VAELVSDRVAAGPPLVDAEALARLLNVERSYVYDHAAELYQRWGMEIVAFHRHAVTEARRRLKPSIPERGTRGISIAHEFELELRLQRPHRSRSSF
jgi:hypothetical protein